MTTTQNTLPQQFDTVIFNGHRDRIEWVLAHRGWGTTVRLSEFEIELEELELTTPAAGYSIPAVWTVRVDENGRRF